MLSRDCHLVYSSTSMMSSNVMKSHRSERRGERVTGVYDLPLQGGIGGAHEQLEPRLVEVAGEVLLFGDQCHIRESWLQIMRAM